MKISILTDTEDLHSVEVNLEETVCISFNLKYYLFKK